MLWSFQQHAIRNSWDVFVTLQKCCWRQKLVCDAEGRLNTSQTISVSHEINKLAPSSVDLFKQTKTDVKNLDILNTYLLILNNVKQANVHIFYK